MSAGAFILRRRAGSRRRLNSQAAAAAAAAARGTALGGHGTSCVSTDRVSRPTCPVTGRGRQSRTGRPLTGRESPAVGRQSCPDGRLVTGGSWRPFLVYRTFARLLASAPELELHGRLEVEPPVVVITASSLLLVLHPGR